MCIRDRLIKNDGGKGNVKIYYPERLGVWNTVANNKYDSTWIFINWEGVEASKKNIDLELYKMSDFGIPYSYSPILFSSSDYINNNSNTVKKFISICGDKPINSYNSGDIQKIDLMLVDSDFNIIPGPFNLVLRTVTIKD